MKKIGLALYDIFLYIKFKFKFKKKKVPEIESLDITIKKIVEEHTSVSRFGDGELKWMLGESPGYKFQKNDKRIEERLKEVLISDNPKLLVCLPDVFISQKEFIRQNRMAWRTLLINNYDKWSKYFDFEKKYYDSNISRFYIDRRDKTQSEERFNLVKQIWNHRNLVIVEGKFTEFGIGNDLLKNSKSVRRVVCPSENAFDKYEELLKFFDTDYISTNDLILIALGPTATILAYDLSNLGYQAIDIGHLDIEYEWFLRKSRNRELIPGKYVNEVKDGDIVKKEINKEYEEQIIKFI